MSNFVCSITVREPSGLQRKNEPITIGVPFPAAAVTDVNALHLIGPQGSSAEIQGTATEHWPDGSVKWALLDWFIDAAPGSTNEYSLTPFPPADTPLAPAAGKITVTKEENSLVVDTQAAVFAFSGERICPVSVKIAGTELIDPATTQLVMLDANGNPMPSEVTDCVVEEQGDLRSVVLVKGIFFNRNRSFLVNSSIRYTFWAGSPTVRLDILIHNPRAALHPGGLWDLGDKGSLYFKDLALQFSLAGERLSVEWQTEPEKQRETRKENPRIVIHQNSSGGKNWNSPNHLNHKNETTVSFCGYRVTSTDAGQTATLDTGRRATPWMKLSASSCWMTGAIENFWEKFPNSLRADRQTLHISVFPEEQGQPYELQGGEQKRHRVFLDFGLVGHETSIRNFLHPVEVSLSPIWIEKSKAVSSFSAPANNTGTRYQDYIHHIIDGENSFFNKREQIDEYGWRNYGDVYADHEAVNHDGPEPFVSHYNNQYDFIYGAIVHFLRSGDRRWWDLAAPAARHMIDIDIYRTDQDKAAYNGGLFWHTDHYREARTSSHRAYSIKNKTTKNYGGGTSNEHIYSSGLALYYFLTGDRLAKETILLLADYVLGMDDGTKTIFGLFDEGPTGLASQTVDTAYHHPGRGAGNCINCLIDAYRLSSQRRYFTKAEELIQRCIHPADDIASLSLDDPEYRWSYLVFLQILGKYLDYKRELGETDYHFFYARDSLLHYADWMLKHEVPYKDVLHKVEIPTETWPAQDIRKCHIFHLAAKYGREQTRQPYTDKASFFHTRCLEDLLSFKSAYLTRPLTLLCVYGYFHEYFCLQKEQRPYLTHGYDFPSPEPFIPQRQRFKQHFNRKTKIVFHLIRRVFQNKIQAILTGH